MSIVTVSDKGQVVIPAAIRRDLGIKPGTELEFELEGSSIRVSLKHSVEAAQLESGYGMLKAKPARRKPRRLSSFDAAAELRKSAKE
ncbi:MAG TPA: AbrB/MazE/SpoVT family DNA-binding domain-containing protein [Ramlibacter sp.]|uniref:AbrB/MazE/SpoVT family DNA-binding domain-containing protein n=1 Tax=Ramlibacter sp. TaxID=1917967 RepID=UPI002CAE3C52|nr:AbrB/MazE/SpoVT family DNA-binding domain-containing protein [Ramlibacter sp.]HVZ42515.1 AbrB/MazE/SpoVT family DNA-binding domain-containing protein [Ramlibacter sp.]